jgi:hypothetical protein
MGYGPDVWGPHGWRFIHFVTMGYPDNPTTEDKKIYKNFLESIQTVLPCKLCANNYKDHLKDYPLNDETLKDKESLMAWGVKVHNLVNKENGKKVYDVNEGISNILKNNKVCSIIINNIPNEIPVYINLVMLLFVLLIIYFLIIKLDKNTKRI